MKEANQVVVSIPDRHTIKKWAYKLAAIAVACYLAYVVREIWLPLGLAFLLAMVLDPVVDRMQQRGWSRTAAASFIFGSFILTFGGLAILASPYVIDQASHMQGQFERYFPDTTHQGLIKSFSQMNLPKGVANVGVQIFEGARSGFQRSNSWLLDYGMRFVSNLVWVVIIPVVAFYALRDFHVIIAKALLIAPKHKRETVQKGVADVTLVFGKYIRGLAIVSGLNGLATWALLAALGVQSALVLGVVAGLLYSVPYIGAVLTVALTAAVAFVSGGAQAMLIAVGASIVLHQIIFDQIITPRVLGGQVGLHPILSIFALLAGNLLLGIPGMILAVPVAACIQIAVLTLVPKWDQEISIDAPTPAEAALTIMAPTTDPGSPNSATEQMRESVMVAVEQAEMLVESALEGEPMADLPMRHSPKDH